MFVVIDDAMVRSSLPYDTLFHNVVDIPGVECACTTKASREVGSDLLRNSSRRNRAWRASRNTNKWPEGYRSRSLSRMGAVRMIASRALSMRALPSQTRNY
jgi:hypothetical protein